MDVTAEVKRRLEALGLDGDKYPVCFCEGMPASLSEEDMNNIAEIEKNGHTVFLVTHDQMGDVVMLNYIAVTKYDEEWSCEFVPCSEGYAYAYAYVKSVLTHGTFDYGSIPLSYGGGCVSRCTTY